jgi:hypothetical protein
MNAWVLLLGVILLIIGIFLATIGGIEKFSLERTDPLWLVLFVLGMIVIFFSIGFIIFAYIIDKKSVYNPYKELDNFYNISVKWPAGFLNPPKPEVITIKQQPIGQFIETVISPPLKVPK